MLIRIHNRDNYAVSSNAIIKAISVEKMSAIDFPRVLRSLLVKISIDTSEGVEGELTSTIEGAAVVQGENERTRDDARKGTTYNRETRREAKKSCRSLHRLRRRRLREKRCFSPRNADGQLTFIVDRDDRRRRDNDGPSTRLRRSFLDSRINPRAVRGSPMNLEVRAPRAIYGCVFTRDARNRSDLYKFRAKRLPVTNSDKFAQLFGDPWTCNGRTVSRVTVAFKFEATVACN